MHFWPRLNMASPRDADDCPVLVEAGCFESAHALKEGLVGSVRRNSEGHSFKMAMFNQLA